MTEPHDELMDRLERLDPVSADPAPEPGSTRFNSIKESSMHDRTATAPAPPSPVPSSPARHRSVAPPDSSPPHRANARRRGLVLGIAAAVLAAVAFAGLLVAEGPKTNPAAADLLSAARNTGDATDFRITLVTDSHAMIPGGRAEGEVDGPNLHLVAGPLEMYRIGDVDYLGENGVFETVPAEDQFTPFGPASEAVVTAALQSDSVTDAGPEVLNGVETRRYVVELDDAGQTALAAVPPESQFWFVGDVSEEIVEDGSGRAPRRSGFLEDAESISLWVADGLIHRISVDTGSNRFTYTFYDFGADITIVAPE